MATTITAPAPAAASPAPAAPATSTPAPAPATPAPVAREIGHSGVKSAINPADYPIRENYAAAALEEKLAAIPQTPEEAPAEIEPTVEVELPTEPIETTEAPEVPTPDATEPEAPGAQEPEFEFDPPGIATPEVLSKLIADNPEFGKIVEADPRLKGQLFKTAREAAELQPYREIAPDLETLKSIAQSATEYSGVRDVFLGSTTPEGARKALARIAELAYERGEDGQPLIGPDNNPVIGEDFFGFVDHVAAMDLGHRIESLRERINADKYHLDPKVIEIANGGDLERAQAMVNAAYQRDKAALEWAESELRGEEEAPAQELPPHLQAKAKEIEARERALNEKEQGGKVQSRKDFESGLRQEADKRIQDSIGKIIADVEKQGAVISPYLKGVLPKAMAAKLLAKCQANPALQDQMLSLQRLPIGDASRQRRLAAIDRAVQQYLPDVARKELREAGVQIANASAAKRAKIDAQVDKTNKTEPRGSTGPANSGPATMTSNAAFDRAQAEWQRANPGKPFDKIAREAILPRVLQLMTARAS